MAENKELFGIQLRRDAGPSVETDAFKCIICQQHILQEKATTTPHGRQKILEAAEIRKDIVLERINELGHGFDFLYHCTNECYKSYTLKKTLLRKQRDNESLLLNEPDDEQVPDFSANSSKRLRKEITSRNPPSPKVGSTQLACIICGQIKHGNTREKHRICETNRAGTFLAATMFFKDDVYVRTSDLEDESAVFGSDLYYHKFCLETYLQKYKRQSHQSDAKHRAPNKGKTIEENKAIFQNILGNGYGLTLSEIRDFVNKISEAPLLTNKEVKLYMVEIFGDRIQFSKPKERNQSLLVYSSTLTADQVADKLRALDSVRDAGQLIRQSLLTTDFNLDDEFGEAIQLEHSWKRTSVPEPLIEFLSQILNVDKLNILSSIADDKQTSNSSTEDVEEGCEEVEDNSEDTLLNMPDSTTSCRIRSLFQVLFYNVHKGRKKTPLHLMLGQTANNWNE